MNIAELKTMLDQKAQVMAIEEDIAYRLHSQDERMRCMGFKQGCQFAASLVQGMLPPKARGEMQQCPMGILGSSPENEVPLPDEPG